MSHRKVILPRSRSPGVYLFRDEAGNLLYVGKAKNLQRRVGSYFRAAATHGPRIEVLLERVRTIETIETATEDEALILEDALIKDKKPPFNVRQRDDKSYPYLRIGGRRDRTPVSLVRRLSDDGAEYFGPCTHIKEIREGIDLLRRSYLPAPLLLEQRTPEERRRVRRRERRMAREMEVWLSGGDDAPRQRLEKILLRAARKQDYHLAARVQHSIEAFERIRRESQ